MDKWANVDWTSAGAVWTFMKSQGWIVFVLTLAVGVILSVVVKRIFRPLNHKLPRQVGVLLEKCLLTLLWVFVIVHALRALGVDLISVLGAAGVAGIAIGFAAQTVLSNLISGIFIMSEQSIRIGDYVTTGGVTGTVETVNLLSITLRQPDNSRVRVPCEMLVKSPVVNMTGDSLRRCDFDLSGGSDRCGCVLRILGGLQGRSRSDRRHHGYARGRAVRALSGEGFRKHQSSSGRAL